MATTVSSSHRPARPIPWGRILAWTGMALLILITLFPFWWMVRTALTHPKSLFIDTGAFLPVDATLINFQRVLGMVDVETAVALGGSGQSIDFLLSLRNSIIVSALVTAGQVIFSALAAYAFARMNFPFRDTIFAIYISALMVPGIVTLIPNFIVVQQLGWLNTFAGIVAPTILMTPFAVFFLRQFYLGVNREVEEAAKIDGASIATVFFKVVMPITLPSLTTLAIITAIGTWNTYLWPFLVGKDDQVRVLTVALGIFRSQTPQGSPDWTGLMAGTTLAIVPTILLFLLLGRKILDSIQFSGFK